MLKETEKEQLRMMVHKELGQDADLFDTDAEIDSSLTYKENENIILDKIELLTEQEVNQELAKELEIKAKLTQMEANSKQKTTFWNEIIDNIVKILCVFFKSAIDVPIPLYSK